MIIIRAGLRKYIERLPWLFYKFRIIQRIFDSDNTFARVEDTLDLSQLTIGDNGNWTINGVDTGKTSRGEQGYTPYIQSGTWWIDGVDTNEVATGGDGKTAYQVAVDEGFVGSESEWLSSLKGSAFEYEDFTPQQLEELKGPKGDQTSDVLNINPESTNTTVRMWEGTRNQYDQQQPLADDIITFIREL